MIRSKVAFQHSADGRILATVEVLWGFDCEPADAFCVTAFDDENQLLQQIVLASLSEEETVELVSKVILTVAGRPYAHPWVALRCTAAQMAVMGFRLPKLATQQPERPAMLRSIDLKEALEQTPLPLILMEGPDHIVTFLNEGYLRLAGRQSPNQLLGKPIRAAFPDLEGQPFFDYIQRVFESGEPLVVTEVAARIYSDAKQRFDDVFYDLVYYPVRDSTREVVGVICQPNDVTERTLDRHVRDAREALLYRQWAELDAMYRSAPVGMALVRASDLSIQRINDFNAGQVGKTVDQLIGRTIDELYPNHPSVPALIRKVIQERTARTLQITADSPSRPGVVRSWLWNLSPVLDGRGEVESIASATLEISEQPRDAESLLASEVDPAFPAGFRSEDEYAGK